MNTSDQLWSFCPTAQVIRRPTDRAKLAAGFWNKLSAITDAQSLVAFLRNVLAQTFKIDRLPVVVSRSQARPGARMVAAREHRKKGAHHRAGSVCWHGQRVVAAAHHVAVGRA